MRYRERLRQRLITAQRAYCMQVGLQAAAREPILKLLHKTKARALRKDIESLKRLLAACGEKT